MKSKLATYAAIIALSAATTVAAHAASPSNPAEDQIENQITAQLNQQQLRADSASSLWRQPKSAMQEQIAQPPADDSDLSFIE